MENELKEIKKIKLNAQNIKSTIFKGNNTLKKIRLEEKNIVFRQKKRVEQKEEEKRLETPNKLSSGSKSIGSKIVSPIRGFFDRILDFFGTFLVGVLVNSLPGIIKKVDEFLNSDFIKNVKNFFETLSNGVMEISKFVGLLPKSKRDELDKEIKDLNAELAKKEEKLEETEIDSLQKSIQEEIDQLENTISQKEKERDKLPEENENQWWDFLNLVPNGENSEKPEKPKKSERPEGPSGTGGFTGGSIPRPTKQKPEKMSKGGTITQDDSEFSPRTPYARPEGTPKGRKARESIKTFDLYNRETKITAENLKNQSENNELFAKLAENFNIYNKLREKNERGESDDTGPMGELYGVDIGRLAEATGAAEGDYNSVGVQTLLGHGLGKYQFMSGRKDVQSIVRSNAIAQGKSESEINDLISKANGGKNDSKTSAESLLQYFPKEDQDRLFKAHAENILIKIKEKYPDADVEFLIRRFGAAHISGNFEDLTTPDALGTTGEMHGENIWKAYQRATPSKPQTSIPRELTDTGIKDYKGRPVRMKGAAATQFIRMASDAQKEGVNLGAGISSSYRTKEENAALGSAESSGHRKGTSFDINWNTPAGVWIRENASKYGFHHFEYKNDSTHFDYKPGTAELYKTSMIDPNKLRGTYGENGNMTVALAQQYVVVENERVITDTKVKMVPFGITGGNGINRNMYEVV